MSEPDEKESQENERGPLDRELRFYFLAVFGLQFLSFICLVLLTVLVVFR
jgi:hypothetical protein